MTEWDRVTYGDVAEVLSGFAFKSSSFNDANGLPLVRIRDVVRGHSETFYDGDYDERFVVNDGDWLVGMDGEFSIARWRGGKALLNQRVCKVVAKPGVVDCNFLALAIAQPLKAIEEATSFTTVKHLSAKAMRAIEVPLPSMNEQARIVAVVDSIDQVVDALSAEHATLSRTYGALADTVLWSESDGTEAERRLLGSVMSLEVERVTLEEDQAYRLAGVLNAGGGLIDKGSILGAQTEYAAMNLLRTGRAVMRKLTAWEGPITVVDAKYDGYVASNEFPTFALHGMSPDYFRHVCRSPRLWAEMRQRVTGSVQRRKRLNPDQLLAVELPIPNAEGQLRAVAALNATEAQLAALSVEVERLRNARGRLVEALLAREVSVDEAVDQFIKSEIEAVA